MKEGEAALVAAHQGFLGQVHRRRVVLAVGQPALQAGQQVGVKPANRHRQARHLLIEAGLDQGRLPGFHVGAGLDPKDPRFLEEAGPGDRVATGGQQVEKLAGIGADRQAVVQQALKTVGPRPQAEAMGPQQHRIAVAVGEGVG